MRIRDSHVTDLYIYMNGLLEQGERELALRDQGLPTQPYHM